MQKWYLFLLCLTILFLPTNVFFKLDLSHAYVHGLLVDYLIPKIYLSDLPVLGILLGWLWERRHGLKLPKLSRLTSCWVVLAGIFIVRQFFTENPIASLWFLTKMVEIIGLAIFLITHRDLIHKPLILVSWFISLLFQVAVGIKQFYTQTSFSRGYLPFGEVNFTHSIGLAKDNYFGTENILAYGTTPHPNMLAGFVVVGCLLLVKQLPQKFWFGKLLLIGFTIWLLILTQSISASFAFVIGLVVLVWQRRLAKFFARTNWQKIWFAFLLVTWIFFMPILLMLGAQKWPHNQSFTRRAELNQAGFKMIIDQPLVGIGLNNFTQNLEEFSSSREIVQFIQPAHNVSILWLAETGLLGLALVIFTAKVSARWLKKCDLETSKILPVLTILLPILGLDHYLLSQQLGLLLIIFFFTSSMVTATA